MDVWTLERGHEDARERSGAWRIGPKPVIPHACRCERPWFYLDHDLGVVKCLICARRRALRINGSRNVRPPR